jgi:hypothetical protein
MRKRMNDVTSLSTSKMNITIHHRLKCTLWIFSSSANIRQRRHLMTWHLRPHAVTSTDMTPSSPRTHMPTVLDLKGHAGERGAIRGSSGLNNFTQKTSETLEKSLYTTSRHSARSLHSDWNTGWTTEESRFAPLQRQEIFLSSPKHPDRWWRRPTPLYSMDTWKFLRRGTSTEDRSRQ